MIVDVQVDVAAPEVHAEIHVPTQLSPYKPYDPTQQPPSLN